MVTRVDSGPNGLNLTQGGSVPGVPGKRGNAAGFSGNEANFLSSNASQFNIGNNDCSFACWASFSGDAGAQKVVFSKWNFLTSNRSYVLVYNAGVLQWLVSSNGTAVTTLSASASISLNTPYFIGVYHDAANDQIGIRVNDAAFNTASHSGGLFSSSALFRVGRFDNSTTVGFMDGWVDELASWGRVLEPAAWDLLWNDGDGMTYPG